MTRPEADPARRQTRFQESGPVSEADPVFRRGSRNMSYRRKILEDPESLYKLEIQDLEITKDID